MNPQRPDEPVPDQSATIRHRWPQPQGTGPQQQPPPPPQGYVPQTRRLDYTPDLLPPVPEYEPVKAPKSAWWWVILVGGIALVIAALAVAVILGVRASSTTTAISTGQDHGPRVTDTGAHVTYALPPAWEQRKDNLTKPFTSSIAPKAKPAKDEGAVVVAFPHGAKVTGKASPEQLQAQAKSVAFRNAEFFAPQEGSREAVSTRSLEIDGRPAATASFRIVFKDATRSPTYVRIVLLYTADDAISYVFGMTSPDGKGERAPVDQVMESVRPA
ncbi:hypothetical protein ACIBG8_29425 [Nonomuraea sp. NPDC050556]|uniref:hypothetical protein n=1 Tax=Nonomuraea sp. NPDC050556 TaxID=3364369 RepID=UPI00379AB77A